jgi:ribonucleoside-triphosphate reductase
VKVNTINLARIALETSSEEEYIELLKKRVDICSKTLDIIRSIIKRNIEKGILPNYTYGLIDIKTQYNTIGVNAMYEAVRKFGYINTDEFGNKSYSEKGMAFACKIMDTINEVKDSYSYDYSTNVEFIPGERCAIILCEKDNLLYHSEYDDFIYSNQWIPLMEKCTLSEKIRLGAVLDKKCGGGQISHINVEGDFANEEQSWELLNHIANEGVIYFAWNKKISVCKKNHAFIGEICPTDGEHKVDTYQRIVGYLTPTSTYSKERKEETSKRFWYDLNEC